MNDSAQLLAELRGVQAPTASWVPAIGWWALLLVIVFLAAAFYKYRQRQRAMRWRMEAAAELVAIRAEIGLSQPAEVLAKSSRLARRIALVSYPRSKIAPLQGTAWLQQLDELTGKPLFTQGLGRLLLDAPYQRSPDIADSDLHSLLDSVQQLLRGAGKRGRWTDKKAIAAKAGDTNSESAVT